MIKYFSLFGLPPTTAPLSSMILTAAIIHFSTTEASSLACAPKLNITVLTLPNEVCNLSSPNNVSREQQSVLTFLEVLAQLVVVDKASIS